MKDKRDLCIAPIGEGALILVVAAAGWVLREPLIFTSLGPTAYEMVEKPRDRSARPYNVIVGHGVGMAAGFFSLWVLDAWASPKVASAGFVAPARLWACVIAVVATTFVNLAIGASQPAALSTTLMVSLGSMQTARDAAAIAGAVLLLTAIGEPVRRRRLKMRMASESPPHH